MENFNYLSNRTTLKQSLDTNTARNNIIALMDDLSGGQSKLENLNMN